MKTKILFAIAFAVTSMAFAQKKEVKILEKAIKAGNYVEAKSLVGAAEALMSQMDDKTKEKFTLLKAQAFLGLDTKDANDLTAAAKAYKALEGTKYDEDAKKGLANVVSSFVNGAVDNQNKQEYVKAASKLEQAYSLSPKDTIYLYYAASNYINAKDYSGALAAYEKLRSVGFSGKELQYVATDAVTGEEETYTSKQERDIVVLAKTHINPKDTYTESKAAEIVKNIALIYQSQGESEKALEAMAAARKENPDDILLMRSEADIYLKMKRMDKYQETIKLVLEKDPNNPELLFNLGVSSEQQGNKDQAMDYYKKATELDSSYAAAFNNLAVLILSEERSIVDQMNSLGTSRADYDKYDALKLKRQEVYKKAVPYLEKALLAKSDYIDVARSLFGIYEQLGETSKADAMKAKIETLEGGK